MSPGRSIPLTDIEIIDTELALADLQTVDKAVDRAAKAAKGGDKDAVRKRALFEPRQGPTSMKPRPVRAMSLTDEERLDIRELSLLTAKPVMYVANVSESGFENNPAVGRRREARCRRGAPWSWRCVPRSRPKWPSWTRRTRAEFLAELGLKEPGLDRVIRRGIQTASACRRFLRWDPRKVARLDRAGGSYSAAVGGGHSYDFERGFIRAEVIAFADYIAGKGEAGARDAGKLRLEGKEYVTQEGDVMHFRFNV